MGLNVVYKLLPALALFLFGISLLGESLQQAAGGRLERLLRRMTRGRLRGFFLGLGVTAAVQSSTAVSVLTAEMTERGILPLRRAIPVLAGANVGTTATAWLLVLLQVPSFQGLGALPAALIALAGLLCFLRPCWRRWGCGLLGLLLVLTGLEGLCSAAGPLTELPTVTGLLGHLSSPLLGLLGGMAATVVLQSSGASVGLLQALSGGGAVTCGMAIPVVLGQNIGTCLTVFLVSLGGKRRAGQVAWAHLLFNVIGSALGLLLMQLLPVELLERTAGAMEISVIHSAFNLLCSAVCLPLTDAFAALIQRIAPLPASGALSSQ